MSSTLPLAALSSLVALLAAGCTAIIYGSNESTNESTKDEPEVVAHGSSAGHDRPDAAAGEPGAGGRTSGGAGEGGALLEPSPAAGAAGDSWSAGGAAGAGHAPGGEGGRAGSEGGASTGGTEPRGGRESNGGRESRGGEGGDGASEPPENVGGADTGRGAGGAEHSGGDERERPPAPPVGDVLRGSKLVSSNNCYRCHGSDLAGRSFYPNITADEATGVGSWTDAQLAFAIVGGFNEKGEMLCASMPLYSGLNAQGAADIVAFLRAIPAKSNDIAAVCPGHDP